MKVHNRYVFRWLSLSGCHQRMIWIFTLHCWHHYEITLTVRLWTQRQRKTPLFQEKQLYAILSETYFYSVLNMASTLWRFLKWVSCLLNLLCRFKWFSFPCFLCFYRVSKQVSDLVMIRSVHRFCFWKFTESSLLIPCLTSSSVHLGAPSVKKRISVYFNRKRVAIEALLKWALVRLVESGTLISNGCNQLG